MKPNRGAYRAPPIAVMLAELERIDRANDGVAGASSAHDRLHPRAGRTETMKLLRVLIVEDDLMIGSLLAELLEDLGHVVCAVEIDASAAVAAARRCHPDLMIIDVGFGETSGIAAAKEILEEGFVPHVFVTGDILRGLSLGPEAVLIQRPYSGSDLVAAIARAIGGRASREEAGSV
jgi:CheY-like chemotaxis protein